MILTPKIGVRLALLGLLAALLQVTFFSKLHLLGTNPDGAALVVMTLGLLGGSVAGAVAGFSIGLLVDCLLMQTLGAFAAALMAVGYLAGRYRESVGQPRKATVALLGAGFTLVGVLAFAAIQVGIGVEADVGAGVIGDALVKTLFGAGLSVPVFLGVRLALRPALVEDRPAGRRSGAARTAEGS
jgi:rod shape-determining protein MreD